jgi:hypothetical protein
MLPPTSPMSPGTLTSSTWPMNFSKSLTPFIALESKSLIPAAACDVWLSALVLETIYFDAFRFFYSHSRFCLELAEFIGQTLSAGHHRTQRPARQPALSPRFSDSVGRWRSGSGPYWSFKACLCASFFSAAVAALRASFRVFQGEAGRLKSVCTSKVVFLHGKVLTMEKKCASEN